MDIIKLLYDDIAAINNLKVTGAENCYIIVAVTNDLKRIIAELEEPEEEKNDKAT